MTADGSACIICDQGCMRCFQEEGTMTCKECEEGYVKEGIACMSCPLGCESCSSRKTCTACRKGFEPAGDLCEKIYPHAILKYCIFTAITLLVVGIILFLNWRQYMLNQLAKRINEDSLSAGDDERDTKGAYSPFGPEPEANMEDHLNYSKGSIKGSFKKEASPRKSEIDF